MPFCAPTSLRPRVAFEAGAARMGSHPVTFPSETLEEPGARVGVASYLALWADVLVVRHRDIGAAEGLAAAQALPVVDAMTDVDRPSRES